MASPYPCTLTLDHYREPWATDRARLYSVAERALTTPVAGCPGWNGEELVRHTTLVYLQKAETIRTGKKPQGKWVPQTEQFNCHDPADPA